MNIDVAFPPEQRTRLALALPKGADVDEAAALLAKAGALELLAQAAGTAVFSSITDLRAFRIYCMLQAGMTLPQAEVMVTAVFGVESRRAKTMVNAAVARYRAELHEQVGGEVRRLLNDAWWTEDTWTMRLPAMFIRDRVNDELEQFDVPAPVSANRGSQWTMVNETYQALRTAMDLPDRPPPN